MASGIRWEKSALDALGRDGSMKSLLADAAEAVRDEARRNAQVIAGTDRTDAISADAPAEDADGAFVDVGYAKHHKGYVLWWHEVGTVKIPARPHLRPALRPGII